MPIPPNTPLGLVQVTLDGAPTIGAVTPQGQMIHLGSLSGWSDSPGSSGQFTQKVNAHGAWMTPAYYSARVIQVLAHCDGFDSADSLALANQLVRAVSLNSLKGISVTDESGETLSCQVRQEGDPILTRTGNRVSVSLSLGAPDPLRYSAPATVSIGLAISGGGLTLPLVLPLMVGGVTSGGSVTITNSGDQDSHPVLRVLGPCAPFMISDSNGRQLNSVDPVPAGRTLIMDTALRTALLDGISNRVVTGTWPRLVPGVNQILFRASTYDAGSILAVTYRSARR